MLFNKFTKLCNHHHNPLWCVLVLCSTVGNKNVCNIKSRSYPLMSQGSLACSAMARQRRESLAIPWRGKRVARGVLKKTKEVRELSSRKWTGHRRRRLRVQVGWTTFTKARGAETNTCPKWDWTFQRLSTACLTIWRCLGAAQKAPRGVGGGEGLDASTQCSPLYLFFTLLPT